MYMWADLYIQEHCNTCFGVNTRVYQLCTYILCDTHISFLSVAHLYVYTWIDRLVETSNITYRNTEIHPTHILRLVVCVQCSIRVYVWIATRRNIEYRIQKYWTHIRGHFYNRTEETRLSIRRRFIRVLPL